MAAPYFSQTEINWDKLDKTKFYVVGAGLFTGVTVALYPVSVVKTRLQVASRDTVERNALSVVKGLLKTDGIPGLYRGFGTVITGAIPARIIFLSVLETTKVAAFRMLEPFRLSETAQAAIANGVAGMMSSFFAQSVFVPIDVNLEEKFHVNQMPMTVLGATPWMKRAKSMKNKKKVVKEVAAVNMASPAKMVESRRKGDEKFRSGSFSC